MEAVEVPIAVEEGLLDGIGRGFAIADHAHDKREEVVLVETHELVESLELAGQRLFHERPVTDALPIVQRLVSSKGVRSPPPTLRLPADLPH